ncbi:hypothetical protein ASH00_15735 [Arthrobacter sp. Soil782]|uniref:hypothetical protein n=1 Tax=Arthrobacter sp. Soil782 TaxID=1736410 RepID=UPI0006FA3B30|nr:hypothetical protein [Arthrobacter sp. Soil782]KRF03235.1 hypothetical protein ASH00_15735 [Arthrobacter sp. Soil782]
MSEQTEPLRRLVAETAAKTGITPMAAVAVLRDELDNLEREVVAEARSEGATWQQIADELRLASRQWAQSKFSQDNSGSLPGMSAAAVARRLGIHQQTVAAQPEKYGVTVKTYPGVAGGRGRKRYFLPGDEGSVSPSGE